MRILTIICRSIAISFILDFFFSLWTFNVPACSVMSNSFVTPWTVARQTPLSIRFPRQEYWSGLPFRPPRDLLDPGIKPVFPALQLGFFTTEPLGKTFLINSELLKPKRISGKEVRD